MQRWEMWELEQRRHALQSLIESYSVTKPGSRRHRMYLRELDMCNAEIARRHQLLAAKAQEVYEQLTLIDLCSTLDP